MKSMYIEFNDLKKSKYTINDYEFVEFPNIVRIYFIDNVIDYKKYFHQKKLETQEAASISESPFIWIYCQ